VVCLLALTWIPAFLGEAFGVSPLRSWGVLSGYAGLSWAFPGLIAGLIVDGLARAQQLSLHRLLGILAGVATAIPLLLGAARFIGA